MLDVYATDIVLLLAERHVDSAERHALWIPHIAIALADAGLHSSRTGYREWCTRWVKPDLGMDVYDEWYGRSSERDRGDIGVPFAALRALRLTRRAREVTAPVAPTEAGAENSKARGLIYALIDAECRWYEQQGRHEATVQTNLARLGVLR
jgi:hypothetical protein